MNDAQREEKVVKDEVRYIEDYALVQRLIAGDRASWADLIRRHERTVHFAIVNTLRTYGAHASADRVADLQGDVMVDLVSRDYRKLRRYSGRCRLDHWLKVVAGNYTIDTLRKKRPTVSLTDDTGPARSLRESLPSPGPSPDARLSRHQRLEGLRALYTELSPGDQRFVELYVKQELSFEEVAAAMNTTVGAVYARKNRVRKKLTDLAQRRGL